MVSLALTRPQTKAKPVSKKTAKKDQKFTKWELEPGRISYGDNDYIEFGDKYYAMATISRNGFGRMVKGAKYYVIISGKNADDYKVLSRHDNKEVAIWNLTNATKEPMLDDLIKALRPKKSSNKNVMNLEVKQVKPINITNALSELAAMHLIDKNPKLQDGLDKADFKSLLAVEKKRFQRRLEGKAFRVQLIGV